MNLKIGISGAQSVGKTTLLSALRSETWFKNFTICNEVTRKVKNYGLDINENGTDLTQILIMQEHIVNLFMNRLMITDRTVLDGLVYSEYLHENDKISSQTFDYVKSIFIRCIRHYDLLFYIEPEFSLQNDGVRSINVKFRDRIVELFEKNIEKHKVNYYKIGGSVRERVNKVFDVYKLKVNEYEQSK